MKRICVFCGSSFGKSQAYKKAARSLGRALFQRRLGLVYGGSGVGLMGEVADSVLAAGGEVIGVIPSALVSKEVAHRGLSDLRVVGTMHERKALMAELSDGFIALPGGMGTFEEFFEMTTWAQLGMHHKPCGLLNVARYYDKLIEFLDQAMAEGFIKPVHRLLMMVASDGDSLLDKFENYRPVVTDKWIDRRTT
jgi:uncharacterized protein (TIGR00730 family)